MQPHCTHLSCRWGGLPDLLGQLGQGIDKPALAVKLLPQPLAAAAQQGRQQVLVADAELGVFKAILQQPARQTKWGIRPLKGSQARGYRGRGIRPSSDPRLGRENSSTRTAHTEVFICIPVCAHSAFK